MFFAKNGSIRLKIGKFSKHPFSRLRRKKKNPIGLKGLFVALAAFSESQLHARKKLNARNWVIVIKLVFLASHIIKQRKGRDLVVHLVIRAEAEVEDIL